MWDKLTELHNKWEVGEITRHDRNVQMFYVILEDLVKGENEKDDYIESLGGLPLEWKKHTNYVKKL